VLEFIYVCDMFKYTYNVSILNVLECVGFVSVIICKRNSALIVISNFLN
jgi:hypothetical protein